MPKIFTEGLGCSSGRQLSAHHIEFLQRHVILWRKLSGTRGGEFAESLYKS